MKNKMVSKLGQLLVTLTGMIDHGHGEKTFSQYSNELWQFHNWVTLHLFHSLEKELVKESRVILNLNCRTHSSNKSCKEVPIV